MNKLLFKLTAYLPCRLIKLDSGPYLERYFLFQILGVTFYLHRFVSSDSERHMHNHPWRWGRALVLSGQYMEESVIDLCPHAGPSGAILKLRRIRWWNRINGNHFHRISCAVPGTWTLFFHGPRSYVEDGPRLKGWGFLENRNGQTVFVDVPPSINPEWWVTAPKGHDIERVPYEWECAFNLHGLRTRVRARA